MKNKLLPLARAERFIAELLAQLEMPKLKADSIAEILLEGELLGHRTHGLQLLMPYVAHIQKNSMEKDSVFELINSTTVSELWDGHYAPGPWLINSAITKASTMAETEGVGTVVIQKCSHIGCLAAYMEAAVKLGNMVIVACSDPDNATVAPFGGTTGVYSPNPLALGIPTEQEPIIIDVSMSATSNGLILQKKQKSRRA